VDNKLHKIIPNLAKNNQNMVTHSNIQILVHKCIHKLVKKNLNKFGKSNSTKNSGIRMINYNHHINRHKISNKQINKLLKVN